VGCESLIAEADLIEPSKTAIIQIETEADKLRPHGKRVNASVGIFISANIPHDDEFTRAIAAFPINPESRLSQLRQTRKQQGPDIDGVLERLQRGVPLPNIARQVRVPGVLITRGPVTFRPIFFDQQSRQAEG